MKIREHKKQLTDEIRKLPLEKYEAENSQSLYKMN